MKLEQVKEIANAVLYEGYLLYPYRHSAIKNRQRWTIGIVYPRDYSEANGSIEPCTMHSECLVAGQADADTTLDITVRFLHLLVRTIERPDALAGRPQGSSLPDTSEAPDPSRWGLAGNLAYEPWEEGIEREVGALNLSLRELVTHPRRTQIEFPGQRIVDQENTGKYAEGTTIVREQQAVMGTITISAQLVEKDLFRVSVHIENTTPWTAGQPSDGDMDVVQRAPTLLSFVSTHTLLQVRQGNFISLMDPPEVLKSAVQGCKNLHTWPVLVGEEGEHEVMLSSPIILYDYPQIAPESAGTLFDGTEIDEILTLRIMTLTDEEKQEIREGDERAREILERTEALSSEQLMKLHGVIRSLGPAKEP